MMRNPCMNCPDHHQPCSDHCQKPEYLAWKEEQETIRKNRAAYNGMNDYVFRQSERNKDGSKRTYEQMFYHVPKRKNSQTVQVERERDGLRPGSILGFPDLWNPWCQAGLKRNAHASSSGNRYRIPSEHTVQLVPEAQACSRCNTGISSAWTALVPGGAQVQNSDTRDSRFGNLPGAGSSKSTRSNPLFRLPCHEGQEKKYRGIPGHCR